MKKKLMIAAVAAAALVQSTATLADPTSNGLCAAMPSWTNAWLPCFTTQGGNSVNRAH